MTAGRTAGELAEEALAAPDPGYGARLAAIRAPAADGGVELAVDLHGALVELRFDRWALNRPPAELSALVRGLAAEAGAEALRLGREVLGGLLPEEDPAHPGGVRGPRTRPAGEPEDEAFTPATWTT